MCEKRGAHREKCIHCGLCVKDCVTQCFQFGEDKIPYLKIPNMCISCQHCFSICPKGAITFNGKTPEASGVVSQDDMLSFMRSRRSIRQYKNEELTKEELQKLKDMLPCIPTGANSHSLHFSIVEKKEVMKYYKEQCSARYLKIFNNFWFKPFVKKYEFYKNALEHGEDIIFRGAPHMVVVSSDTKSPCPKEDPIIALTYFELYANSLGFGTCWCGYAQMTIERFPDIFKVLDIPKGYKPIYAMLFGKPAVTYSRLPQPEPYKISEVREIK